MVYQPLTIVHIKSATSLQAVSAAVSALYSPENANGYLHKIAAWDEEAKSCSDYIRTLVNSELEIDKQEHIETLNKLKEINAERDAFKKIHPLIYKLRKIIDKLEYTG